MFWVCLFMQDVAIWSLILLWRCDGSFDLKVFCPEMQPVIIWNAIVEGSQLNKHLTTFSVQKKQREIKRYWGCETVMLVLPQRTTCCICCVESRSVIGILVILLNSGPFVTVWQQAGDKIIIHQICLCKYFNTDSSNCQFLPLHSIPE